jgi:hypothetical protein
MRSRCSWLALLVALVLAGPVRAELVALEILHREPFAGGEAFGKVGPYDQITAIARFAIDPKDAHNRDIVDLDLAPKNAAGKVEFAADVVILAPTDLAKGNGAIFYEVNNRGNKLALGMFNRAPGAPGPDTKNPAGSGWLMRQGYIIVWSGWIGELLPGNGRLLLRPPVAREDRKLVRGTVRYEMVSDTPAKSLPLSRREGHGSYPPTAEGEMHGVLTKRLHEADRRQPIPRSQWKLVRMPMTAVKEGVPGTLAQVRVELEGGFEPGVIYELICEAEGSIVQGTGFASVRDLVSFLRYDATPKNPLRRADGKPAIDRALAFGVSQSGRFLRHFLYLGFDEDEQGRAVFEGLMPHVAGGGLGFFNHRFAQPTRHNGQHEEHLYPTDVFPFTYGPTTDPFANRTDSILGRYAKSKVKPKVMHTQTSAEYWHRSGSLVHTSPDGKADADLPANARIYAFGGCQHGPGDGNLPTREPPIKGLTENHASPADYRPFLRALLVALDAWAKEGKEPPRSVYPKIAEGTLVDWHQDRTGFPKIPGIRYPTVIQQPPFADYGPSFQTHGMITLEPPQVKGYYTVLVPKSADKVGTDAGCLLPPDVAMRLATYTGWNTRRASAGASGALVSLLGSCIRLAQTRAEREAVADPRPSFAELHPSFKNYLEGYRFVLSNHQERRTLLPEDADLLGKSLEKHRALFPNGEGK